MKISENIKKIEYHKEQIRQWSNKDVLASHNSVDSSLPHVRITYHKACINQLRAKK